MLTQQHVNVLRFVKHYQATNGGVSPTYDDIAEGIGVSAKSTVCRFIDQLEERGFVRRLANHARAIEILKAVPGDKPAAIERDIIIPHAGRVPVAVARLCPQGRVS